MFYLYIKNEYTSFKGIFRKKCWPQHADEVLGPIGRQHQLVNEMGWWVVIVSTVVSQNGVMPRVRTSSLVQSHRKSRGYRLESRTSSRQRWRGLVGGSRSWSCWKLVHAVGLEVGSRQHRLQLFQLLVGDLALPLELATALLNHCAQASVRLHELDEGLGEALGSDLTHVHREHDQVEVSFDIVHDLVLEVGLPVVAGHVEGHLGLDDALADVLYTSTTWGRSSKVNQFVNLSLGNLGSGMSCKQLFDHVEYTHLHGIAVLLNVNIDAGKTEFLLLQCVKNVIRNNAAHSVQLPGQLQLLHQGADHNRGGGARDASLAVENDRAGGGGVLQHGDNLVEVLLGGGLLLVHRDAKWLNFGHLLLDCGVDLVDGGDTGKLLGELLVGGSLLRVFTKLVLEVLEVLAPLPDLLGEVILKVGALLGVVDLKVEVHVLGISGGEWLVVHIHNRLLSEVHPEDVLFIAVLLEHRLQARLEALDGGLTGAEDGKARQPSKVGGAFSSGGSLSQPVDTIEGICHRFELSRWRCHDSTSICARAVLPC